MTLELTIGISGDTEVPPAALQRAERLARGYLEADLTLRRHGIRHTIVVFGSTRITSSEPGAEPLATDYYEVAREFGRLVGRSGRGPADSRVTLATGGGPGIMEAANRGAHEVGAKSIGLNIRLPREQVPNPYVSRELSFQFHYFAIRKLHFLLRARALVVFPGGFGTLDELLETLNLVQCRTIRPLPVIIVGRQFWERVLDLAFLETQGLIDPVTPELLQHAETAQEIWDAIINWHRSAGKPLFDEPH